jgi:tetratricopeptide (TPR) repeat protein
MFRYIASVDPRELEIGIGYLQKAIKEDAGLAEAHTWLTYAYARSRRYDDALETGKRATELDPGNYMAYYMLGCVYWFRAALEYRCSLLSDAVTEFQKSIAAEPNYPWTHLHLGWVCMQHGQYTPAEKFFEEAIAIQDSAGALKAGPRFYGARTLLALLLFRAGHALRAEELHCRSIAELRQCDHVYREVLMGISYCGLGDVAFQRALYNEALEKFRMAEHLLVSHPRIGAGHILVQALLRQCQTFIALNETDQASRYLGRARDLLAHKQGFDFGFTWEAWDAQSYYDLAICQALFGKSEDALTFLKKAVACGWRDHLLLNVDLRLSTLRGMPGFRDLIPGVSHLPMTWNGTARSEFEGQLKADISLPSHGGPSSPATP